MEMREKKHDEQYANLEITRKIDKELEKIIGKNYTEDIEKQIIDTIKKYDCKIIKTTTKKASHTRDMIDKYFYYTKNGHETSAQIAYLVALTNNTIDETNYSCFY